MVTPASRVFVAGHNGMVGRAVLHELSGRGFADVITASRAQLDLLDGTAVDQFFAQHRPQALIIAAAKVGGIEANRALPVDFLQENLLLQTHLLQAAFAYDVARVVFLGSSCIYPRLAPQPIVESALLDGHLEPTNDAYAVAKITGIKLCEAYNRQHGTDYRSLMPTNLYGPGDNFHPQHAHVVPALMRRLHEAKAAGADAVEVWGSGQPLREFLHVADLAEAVAFALTLDKAVWDREVEPHRSHLNVGTGQDIQISKLVSLLADIIGYTGRIEYNTNLPDGTPRKLLDVSRLQRLGWTATTPLGEGLRSTYRWFCEHPDQRRL